MVQGADYLLFICLRTPILINPPSMSINELDERRFKELLILYEFVATCVMYFCFFSICFFVIQGFFIGFQIWKLRTSFDRFYFFFLHLPLFNTRKKNLLEQVNLWKMKLKVIKLRSRYFKCVRTNKNAIFFLLRLSKES